MMGKDGVDADLNVDHNLRELTKAAVYRTQGSRTEAAKVLGISIRTLRNWIRRYDLGKQIPPPRQQQAK